MFEYSCREPVVGANRRRIEDVPLSKRPMKVGRVSPLQLFKRSEVFSGNLGGNAGIYSRPCLLLGREFFVLKAFSNG